jgi:hypothetical protein
MLLHALGTISTHGNSCFGQNDRDGCNRWTVFAYHSHFVVLLQKKFVVKSSVLNLMYLNYIWGVKTGKSW